MQLRRMAWAACQARHLAAAYLLCDAASNPTAAGPVGGPLSSPAEGVAPPVPASVTRPRRTL